MHLVLGAEYHEICIVVDRDSALARKSKQVCNVRRERRQDFLQCIAALQEPMNGKDQSTRITNTHANHATVLVEDRETSAAVAAHSYTISSST